MAPNKLHFRIATANDAPQLQELVQSAFRAQDSRKGWIDNLGLSTGFSIAVGDIAARIAMPDNAFLVGNDDDGTLMGCIEVRKRSPDIARLAMLAVYEHCQQGGLGRQVLEYGEEYCQRTWGVKTLELNALSVRQELISWYMRRGYKKTGETEPFPFEHVQGMALPEDLCFIMLEKDVVNAAE